MAKIRRTPRGVSTANHVPQWRCAAAVFVAVAVGLGPTVAVTSAFAGTEDDATPSPATSQLVDPPTQSPEPATQKPDPAESDEEGTTGDGSTGITPEESLQGIPVEDMGAEEPAAVEEATAPVSLLVHFAFDETSGSSAANTAPDSKYGAATLMNGAAFTDGAVHLDGDDDYVDLPDDLLAELTDVTVSVDVLIDKSQAAPYWIYGLGNAGATEGDGYLFTSDDDEEAGYRTAIATGDRSTEQNVTKGSPLARGKWKTLTYTLAGETATLYEDGSQMGQETVTLDPKDIGDGSTTDNSIGRSLNASDAFLRGQVRDFRVYDGALTGEEVAELTAKDPEPDSEPSDEPTDEPTNRAMPAPLAQVTSVKPIPECMVPVGNGQWDMLFGWEATGTGDPLVISEGPENQVRAGTLVSGPLPTEFTNPVGRADGSLGHPVWPVGYETRTGRTAWWTEAPVRIRVEWGGRAEWRLGGTTAQLGAGAATQRCSQHLFMTKTWDGKPTPPDNLDWETYELRLQMQANPNEPDVLNTGIARCRYQEVDSKIPGMPYGTAFVDPPVFSPELKCVYENKDLPYGVDQDGYWIPKGGVYRVEESGLPDGWYPGSGIGADQVIDFEDAATVAQCGYYPGYDTPVEVSDSDGSTIPRLGRASDKWCVQPVENLSEPAEVSVTKTVKPATVTDWEFEFTIDPAPPTGPVTKTATAENPTVTWTGLYPDVTYTITETPKDGYQAGPIVCPDGDNSVRPPAGGTAECRVTNTVKPAELSVTKSVTGEDVPEDWAFDFTIDPAPADGPSTLTATADEPTVTFTGLDPGVEYTVTEAAAEGFKQVKLDCGNGEPTATLGPGETLACTAENTVAPPVRDIYVEKLGAQREGDPTPVDGAEFQLLADANDSPGEPIEGISVEPVADETGRFVIKGIPPGTYWLLETKAPPGYNLLAEPVQLIVDDDGSVSLGDPGRHPHVSLTSSDPEGANLLDTVQVTDLLKVALPFTGSGMAPPLMALGLTALLAAGAWAFMSRRRRLLQAGGMPPAQA